MVKTRQPGKSNLVYGDRQQRFRWRRHRSGDGRFCMLGHRGMGIEMPGGHLRCGSGGSRASRRRSVSATWRHIADTRSLSQAIRLPGNRASTATTCYVDPLRLSRARVLSFMSHNPLFFRCRPPWPRRYQKGSLIPDLHLCDPIPSLLPVKCHRDVVKFSCQLSNLD